jgi:cytochrome c oxidase subunit 4
MSTRPSTRDEATGPVVEPNVLEGGTHHEHPGEAKYIKIALILAAITAGEVAMSYWGAIKSFRPPLLIAMSVVKFAIVAAFFMHLRFDSRLFRRLFIAGICLAIFCFTAVLTTFHIWTRVARQ